MIVACIFGWVNDMLAIGLSFVFVVFAFLTRDWRSPIGQTSSSSETAVVRRRRYSACKILELLCYYMMRQNRCSGCAPLLMCTEGCVCVECPVVCIIGHIMSFVQLTFENGDSDRPTIQPSITNDTGISTVTSNANMIAFGASRCRRSTIEPFGRSRRHDNRVRVWVRPNSQKWGHDLSRPRMPPTTIK